MEKIKEFLHIDYKTNSGYGSCFNDGDSSGDGYGFDYGDVSGSDWGYGCSKGDNFSDGSGYGYGGSYGYGNGFDNGSGYGYGGKHGYGSGIKSLNGNTIYFIDDVPTIINHIRNNVAKGSILNDDFTLSPCYIVKQNNLFAHGETLRKAQESLENKLFGGLSDDKRINVFLEKFQLNVKYPAMNFYDWHNKLTGSCEMGRRAFVKNHNIDLQKDEFTIDEFIELCKNDYGGRIIQMLEAKIKERY